MFNDLPIFFLKVQKYIYKIQTKSKGALLKVPRPLKCKPTINERKFLNFPPILFAINENGDKFKSYIIFVRFAFWRTGVDQIYRVAVANFPIYSTMNRKISLGHPVCL